MRNVTGLLLSLMALAAAAPWNRSLDANLTANQSAYSDNWGGNATGLFTWSATTNFLAERQFRSWLNSKNTVKLAFGESYAQDTAHHWASPVKSTDLVDVEAVLRFPLGAWVDPFASGRLETQFLDESERDYKRLFNPMTFTEGFGVARVFLKQNKRELTSRLGGGLKQVLSRMVLDTSTHLRANQAGSYGGLASETDFNTPLFKDKVSLTSKLTIFQALFYSDAAELAGKPNANYWRHADFGWENTFTAGITKLLMVNLYTQLLYDREIDAGARFKETLALGLTYRLL